jgi:ATP-dependent protease Clp ATPase subunit
MTKSRALKKVLIAITKMIDLQDAGYGCDDVARILEKLNHLEYQIKNKEVTNHVYTLYHRR